MASTAIQSRGRVMGSLTTIRKFLANMNQDTTCSDIEVRLNKLDNLWSEFQVYEDQVAMLVANNPTSNLELKQDEFESKFFDTKSRLLEMLKKLQAEFPTQPTTTNSFDLLLDQQRVFLESLADRTQAINERSIMQSSENMKLPHVQIDKFCGEYEAWPSFYDLYTSSVHNLDSISKVHKFQILKGLLRGPPLNIIRNFLVTDTNYTEAWEKLVKRYNKPRTILNSLIDRFIEQPSAMNSSPQSLRQISDTSDEIIRGIKALGDAAEHRDPWLIRLLLNKVDEETRIAWANDTLDQEFPTIYKFLEFLNDRCYAKESSLCDAKKKGSKGSGTVVKTMHVSPDVEKCPCCKRQHNLRRCISFKRMTIEKRRTMVNRFGVCFNCLRDGHVASNCPVDDSCHTCNARHNTLLHLDTATKISEKPLPNASTHQTQTLTANPQSMNADLTIQTSSSLTAVDIRKSNLALLPTALVYVRDSTGNKHIARALLDSGSQSSFISESLCKRLDLERSFANVRVSGISESKAGLARGLVTLSLESRFNHHDHECFEIKALILMKLTSTIPPSKIDVSCVEELNEQKLQLADPAYHIPSKIDILLGADIFFEVLEPNKLKFRNQLIAQSTKFGWVISGAVIDENVESKSFSVQIQPDELSKSLEKFWKLEEVPTVSDRSESENLCESHFLGSHERSSDGRYVVRLPFNSESGDLGHSKSAAVTRLFSMERKFKKNPDLQEQYANFMQEYFNLGHMEEIKPIEVERDQKQCFYLPHHAVEKSDSTTTKLRVVFDGSCKSSTGISLNDKLLVGLTIQKDLVSILMMFRKHAIAFSSDVEKMYRQVKVNKSDHDFQRVLWRKTASEPIKSFRLTTVTYGTSCALFLAVRTLHQIAEDYKPLFPVGSIIAKRDFYVDDCLSGANSTDEAILAMQEVANMLVKGGFKLRKSKSNSTELMSVIPAELRDDENLDIDDNSSTVKTLGLQWNPKKDTFSYNIKIDHIVSSKRQMLSQIARIFDPLGWVSPAIIIFKISLQKLWLRKLDWDDPRPEDIEQQWKANQSSLLDLRKVEVPRFLKTNNSTKNVQLHGFCDASEHAYAAVVYLRTSDEKGQTNTTIVISKTKVAPLKQVSLPRLELCGAVLLSRLLQYTKKALDMNNPECYAWTDSEIVLSWLSDVPRRWKCFIGNRTSEILENLPRDKWNHVSSKENPADIASRGVTPKQLLDCPLWWTGPSWLLSPTNKWPTQKKSQHTTLEGRAIALGTNTESPHNHTIEELFKRVASYSKIKRILARILKFSVMNRHLDTVELLKKAEKLCVKWAQSEEFESDINSIKQTKKIGSKSKIISLYPFVDKQGLLRVGGRLGNLNAPYDVKHPMLLPKKHVVTDKIMKETHIRYLHPGPTLQTSILRQKYWILNCRNAVRSQINNCVECRRERAATAQQLMGNLPVSRITPSRPFLHTGVDYAGPLSLKSRVGRGRIAIMKGYICLFICFATKAIHIELCHDMTAEAFIAALRRFISRRGVPVEIISDNGTNFVGAARLLGELHALYEDNYKNQLISNFISQNEIKFTLNPPSGPHFGGLWESRVKSIKHHLNRVTRNTNMTAYEMETLLVQIEGILNSRPLCPITDDIEDLGALTPAHFLIGEPITAIPEASLEHIAGNRLSRWQNVQARMQGFWKKWQIDYLHTLQQRRQWNEEAKNIKIGDLVLIKEDNLPPSKWLMGRIITHHPGSDGLVRVVSIKTFTGTMKRPIVKLCPLLSSEETTSMVSYLAY